MVNQLFQGERPSPLISDLLTANLPIFSLFAGGNRPQTMQWSLKISGRPVSARLTICANDAAQSIAAMSERKLWLLVLNKCVRRGSWDNPIDLARPVETVTLDLSEIYAVFPELMPRTATVSRRHIQVRENAHLLAMQNTLDCVHTLLATLANTGITITDLDDGFAPISFALLEGCHITWDSRTLLVGQVSCTLTFPQWILRELVHGCLYYSHGYFNIDSLLGMRLYDLAASLHLSDTNPSADIPLPLICDRTAYHHDSAHLLKRLLVCVKHNRLPDFSLSFDGNRQILRISKRPSA